MRGLLRRDLPDALVRVDAPASIAALISLAATRSPGAVTCGAGALGGVKRAGSFSTAGGVLFFSGLSR